MIDNYCERTDASFWSEPVNALTNLSFIIAGLLAISLLRKSNTPSTQLWLLAYMMLLIGVGSFLFHTFASPLTALADGLPIYAFQLTFLWCYPRFALGLGRWQTGGIVGLFVAATAVSSRIPFDLNESQRYIPTILVLGLFAFFAARRALTGAHLLAIAALIFAVSLMARTVDELWCINWPLGTHFIWHTLNGLVLYLSWLSLYRARRSFNAKTGDEHDYQNFAPLDQHACRGLSPDDGRLRPVRTNQRT